MSKQRRKLIDEIKELEAKVSIRRVIQEDRKLRYYSKGELEAYKFYLQMKATQPQTKTATRLN